MMIQKDLEKLLLKTILPGEKPKIEYRWSGVMGFGKDLIPIVKEDLTRVLIITFDKIKKWKSTFYLQQRQLLLFYSYY